MKAYNCLVFAVLQGCLVISRGETTLNVHTVNTGDNATFECTSTSADSTALIIVYQNDVKIYECIDISFACIKLSPDPDYTDIIFTSLGSLSATGTFTVTNASETRDGGRWKCQFGSLIESSETIFTVSDPTTTTTASAPAMAVLSVQNVVEGETATFECSYSSITSTPLLKIRKDTVLMYDCVNIAFTCSALLGDTDYSDVTFTGISTAYRKGTFTVDNANQARDGGSWTCKYGSSLASDPVIFVVNVSETNNEDLYWLLLLVLLLCVVLVIVIVIVSGHKTLVISMLYVKVTKNIVQLSWKPTFEPVSNTTYAKCAQNGLTENAEFIDGLFVVVFRELTPEKQHDVTIYCQNAVDMKLYKSETCVVFTLKDYSNTNPKECNPVLALHSLDLTVYQKKVELSWTSPLAFDSTKVEYWVGSDKHITISANKPSLATSTAEMTRLLPGRIITFTITGEKDGTKYPSGILHQKTLKGLTDCCP